jgi:hypothetical protein
MFISVPLLVFLLIHRRMRWVHQERMTALEKGIVLDFNESKKVHHVKDVNTTPGFTKGFVLLFVGLALILTFKFSGGFGVVVGSVMLAWGMALLLVPLARERWQKNTIMPDTKNDVVKNEGTDSSL